MTTAARSEDISAISAISATQVAPARVAIVTGAGAGIGLAITDALTRSGVHVHTGSRHVSDTLGALASEGTVQAHIVDLATAEGPAALVAAAGPRIDIPINNVGGSVPRPGGFVSITDQQWHDSLALNLMAAVRTTRAALSLMLQAGGGSIVNVVSANAVLPDPSILA